MDAVRLLIAPATGVVATTSADAACGGRPRRGRPRGWSYLVSRSDLVAEGLDERLGRGLPLRLLLGLLRLGRLSCLPRGQGRRLLRCGERRGLGRLLRCVRRRRRGLGARVRLGLRGGRRRRLGVELDLRLGLRLVHFPREALGVLALSLLLEPLPPLELLVHRGAARKLGELRHRQRSPGPPLRAGVGAADGGLLHGPL